MNGKLSSSTAVPADAAPPGLKPVSVPAYLAGTGAGIALLLALFEPVTSGGLSLLGRLLFFALHMGPALALAWALTGWLFGLRSTRRLPPWLLLAIAGFATGLVLAPWSVLLESLFGVVELDEEPSAPAASAGAAFLAELREDLLVVPPKAAAIWLVVNLAIAWRLHVNTGSPEDVGTLEALVETPPEIAATSLFARIPARMGRDVIYMEAQEHYLRVVLVGGEQLLLLGLANAIRELEASGATGMQVHRSYWVNWAHVRRVVADSGGGYCELAGEISVPVSRRRASAVRAAFHAFPGGGSATQGA